MKKLITILLILLSNISYSQGCLKVDVMLVVDMSGSVKANQVFIKESLNNFINRFDLSDNGIKIGLIYFNGYPTLASELTSDKNKLMSQTEESVMQSVLGGATYLETSLDLASEKLLESERNVAKTIILISDGYVDDYGDCLMLSKDIRNNFGILMIGLLIENGVSVEENMISMTNKTYISNYQGLLKEMENLDICF